jgi:chromosome partitioning protein
VKILAVLSEKGGAGKTTVSVHLAVAAQLAGLNTAIIDLDPQASSADWCDRRGSAPEGVAIPPSRLEKLLSDLRGNETDLVVLDCGRDSHNAGYLAAMASDFALIPMRTGGFDFQALNRTLDMCRLAGKRPCLLLNGMRPGATRAVKDAREALAGDDRDIAPMVMHTRAVYATASITARTAQEMEPGSAAAEEVTSLSRWILGQLGLSTTRQKDQTTTRQRKRKAVA